MNFYNPSTARVFVLALVAFQSSGPAYAVESRAAVFFQQGEAYLHSGKNDLAAVAFSRSLAIDPHNAQAYAERGAAYGRSNRYREALADFTQYLKMKPRDIAIRMKRAFVYGALNQDTNALRDFQQILAAKPRFSDAYVMRGYLYMARGEYGRAIADQSRALALNPNAADAYMGRGNAEFEAGFFSQAAQDLSASLRGMGMDAYPVLWLHLARNRAGQNDRSEFEQNAAKLNLSPWPGPVVNFYLGKTTAAQMLAAAADPGQRCEAHFYLGEWQILRGHSRTARANIETAARTCPRSFSEYAGARAEKNRLP